MSVARTLLSEVCTHGGRVVLSPLGELRVTAPKALPSDLMARLRHNKQALLYEIKPSLPWWLDQAAIEVRFNEIAGRLEYGDGFKRREAEIKARELVQLEITDWTAWEARNEA